MEKKNIKVIIVAIMVLSMTLSVATAAQTSFECSVLDGYVHVHSDSSSNTIGSSNVYDATRYRLDLRSLLGNSEISVTSNSDEDFEANSHVVYYPSASGLTGLFLTEEAHISTIQTGEVNTCCDNSIKTSTFSQTLNYDSLITSSPNELLFNSNADGSGSISFLAQESKMSGDPNGTWSETRSSAVLIVYDASYDISVDHISTNYDHLASSTETTRLCPFFKP